MSLFPAYSGVEEVKKDIVDDTWLQNSSFQTQTLVQNITSSSSSDEVIVDKFVIDVPKKRKKPKKEHKNKKVKQSSIDDIFIIDNKATKEYLTVKTISRPSVSKYKIKYYLTLYNRKKNKKIKRYYQVLHNEDDSDKTEKTIDISKSNDERLQEEDLSQKNASYNKTLYEEPNNVQLWLEFIDFQDVMFKIEKTSKKGSVAKGLRSNAERKLTILEKSISLNTYSEDLHRKRLGIMVSVYPADELQKKLKELLNKDQGNIILWQGYIEATQCSMSHCNTSAVLNLYIKCLSTIHKIRRNLMSESKISEESILRILYQCGLFLKQSGLFEQLWTLLKMYLEMNLGQMVKNSFNVSVNIDEKNLLEMEEMIFKSQLPSHELWLRTEKIRESCHWLPVTEKCDDPQRIVFAEDVVELIQPITVPENTFKLTAIILTLLKIPLLPCRHTTIQELGLDYVPWALDSIETLLPIIFPIYPINLEFSNEIFIDTQLAVGPQYIKLLPGQEEYLNFILNVMDKCILNLNGDDQSALVVWWFRFQKLLIILDNNDKFKMPINMKRNIKSKIKKFLKKTENRTNILYYVEYALLEKELNSIDTSIDILNLTLSSVKFKFQLNDIIENASVLYLIRILIELSINKNETDKATKYLVNFVLDKPLQDECILNEENKTHVLLKFKNVYLKLLTEIEFKKLTAVQHFLPIPICDLVICNGWFIYLTKGPLDCCTYLEDVLEKLNEKTQKENLLEVEMIYEFYITILFKFCIENTGYGLFKVLDDVMLRTLKLFPNNLYILSILSKEQLLLNSLGPKWWNIKNLLLKSRHSLPVLILISITHQIINNLQEQLIDTITGNKTEILGTSFKNTMLSLFKTVTKSQMCTRRCGLIWRLYLQFVHKYFDSKLCRNVYYSAVEECPWLKALYIDAAIYIPAELGQIQDLIIEKQLRLHITPEELEVLKD